MVDLEFSLCEIDSEIAGRRQNGDGGNDGDDGAGGWTSVGPSKSNRKKSRNRSGAAVVQQARQQDQPPQHRKSFQNRPPNPQRLVPGMQIHYQSSVPDCLWVGGTKDIITCQ